MREFDALIDGYTHLPNLPNAKDALQMLRKIASLVKPIMRKHGWRVGTLAEFNKPDLLGLNVNRGQQICLRLRHTNNNSLFLPLEACVDTMLHELSHIVHGPHEQPFYELWDKLRDEYTDLKMKGYTGEGFLSTGHRVGGRSVPLQEIKRQARAAAERRRNALQSTIGHKVGGKPVHRSKDIREVIANAALSRQRVDLTCGSGSKDSERIAQEAMHNGFRTKAEEDKANEEAIAEALWDLVEQDKSWDPNSTMWLDGDDDSEGLVWTPENGLDLGPAHNDTTTQSNPAVQTNTPSMHANTSAVQANTSAVRKPSSPPVVIDVPAPSSSAPPALEGRAAYTALRSRYSTAPKTYRTQSKRQAQKARAEPTLEESLALDKSHDYTGSSASTSLKSPVRAEAERNDSVTSNTSLTSDISMSNASAASLTSVSSPSAASLPGDLPSYDTSTGGRSRSSFVRDEKARLTEHENTLEPPRSHHPLMTGRSPSTTDRSKPRVTIPTEPVPALRTWTCPTCTLVNPDAYLCCDVCGAEKPFGASISDFAEVSSMGWDSMGYAALMESPVAVEIAPNTQSPLERATSNASTNGNATSTSASGTVAASASTNGSANGGVKDSASLSRNSSTRTAKRDVHAMLDEQIRQRTDTKPLGWSCGGCGSFMERQWWTCSACGRMKDTSA